MKLKTGQIIVLILIVLVIAAVYISLNKTRIAQISIRQPQTKQTTQKGVIKVLAQNGKFKPNKFDVKLNESIVLQIEARDRNYVFELKEFGISQKLPRGKTTRVKLEGLGKGEYQFSCGQGCTGTVDVEVKSDEED